MNYPTQDGRSADSFGYGLAMLESLPWEDFAGDLDLHERTLEKRESELKLELHQVKEQLRLTRQVKKHRETLTEWQHNGIPEPRRPESPRSSGNARAHEAAEEPGHRIPRKQRITALLAQDPQRRWKARDVAEGLDDPQLKCVRVALDEMTRAKSVIKHPDTTYQHHTADNRNLF